VAIYHRFESTTQTFEVAKRQEQSLEIWGRARYRNGGPPVIQAYPGPLPPNRNGIEFETDIEPHKNSHPLEANWYLYQPGISSRDDFAILKVSWVRIVHQ
jgi:hypothetical protein